MKKQKIIIYSVPLGLMILLVFDLCFTGINPYNIPLPLGWLQNSNSVKGVHCSYGMDKK